MTGVLSISAATLPPAVEAVGLGKWIDDRPILRDINLTVPSGQYVALMGGNGAGKTTLLRILSTLVPPTSGRLSMAGCALPRSANAARAHIGLVSHQSMLYRDLTARENLEFFARLHGVPNPAQRVDELLIRVGMIGRADDVVKTFSRGMTQRVSIARAMVHEPDVLLADEPFAGLDAGGAAAVEELLAELHGAGKTILLVNHDVTQSLRLVQRIIVLRGGRIALDRPAPVADAATVLAAAAA
jgi:heme ABC exporter ATP-binding subunit CcmA